MAQRDRKSKETAVDFVSLILEDTSGQRSVFNGGLSASRARRSLSLNPYNWATSNETGPTVGYDQETSFPSFSQWDGANFRVARLEKARKALRSLEEWYATLLEKDSDISVYKNFDRRVFFNSQLIYLIAATDDSENNVGHSQFVASYALLLARAMGIEDENFLVDLERGALLHDIGKVGLPSSVLRKETPLTLLERAIIKEHPLLGYLLLQDYAFLAGASEVVLYHHEWYDGQGYPFGLKGEEIPLAARIFSLADTLDAITSDRPYRRGQCFEVALKEIIKGSGTQFDPSVVDVFLSIPQERWERARSEALRTFRLPLIH